MNSFRKSFEYWSNMLVIKGLYHPLMQLRVFFNGVKLGKDCKFHGLTFIKRYPESTIIVGDNCTFRSNSTSNRLGLNHQCILTTGSKGARMEIGRNCGFSGTSIWCFDSITIGNNVRVGANVVILDGDAHQTDPRAGKNAPVVIGDNVWIGVGVTILKGVTIGRNSLIGAGSVVVRDIPANTIAAGSPCKPLRLLPDDIIGKLEKLK